MPTARSTYRRRCRIPSSIRPWVDGAVSFRATTELNDLWRLRSVGLVGGFGIGEASQLALGLEVSVGRRLGENTRLWIGYRLLSIDYERGSGSRKRHLDMTMHGLIVGVGYAF